MAIIYTYPQVNTSSLNPGDLLVISDVSNNKATRNTTIQSVLDLKGTGTADTLPLWTSTDVLGDSIITQDSSTTPKFITISGLAYQSAGGSTYFGTNAGENDDQTSSNNNVGIGDGALQTQVTGAFSGVAQASENVAVGYQALNATTTGTNNVAIGLGSLSGNTTGYNNVALSKNALGAYAENNTSLGIGFSTGNPASSSGTISGHTGNTMVGHQALADFNVVASSNVRYNVALGFRALRNLGGSGTSYITSIEDNVIIGRQAGLSITPTGSTDFKTNVFIGTDAGFGITIGSGDLQNNILLGTNAGNAQAISESNIVLQSNTGTNNLGKVDSSSVPYTVSDNVIIGGRSNVYANNNVVIGNGIAGKTNTIGNDAATDTDTSNTIKNVILGGNDNSITNSTTQTANSNSILNSQGSTITGDFNIILNSVDTAITGNNNTVGSGVDNTISTSANYNCVFGNKHTLTPTTGSIQRNFVVGNENEITGGNNGFVGGNESKISSGNNSFAYGNNVEGANDNSATVGKFNEPSPSGQTGALFQIGCGFNDANKRNAINVVSGSVNGRNNTAIFYLDELLLQDFADDAAAATAGIGVGGLYHTSGTVKIRTT